MPSLHQRVEISADVIMREFAGESALLNLDTEVYYGLDEVGTRMWALLTSASSIQNAYEILCDEYDVDAEILKADLIRLVEELIAHGLVTLHDS